ncbi:hypothetical protein M0811_01649 [Anaeramoeba ignava]|uniref:Rap-GAP domain-containing protein n=1 Tax=Anaeramoeba ignava TaxID=1746090 RepID=A0A9Q0LHR2_ANAIG|nr:hypothetical protein M0811_01649 [Anaeramoeba ignava]|eukprot:Anaeramoba_ignava/a479423_132.p1 GENE.a479423_132~~a479423_132.p1  ORF type:complete len:1137 (-),score=323.04 a479423_132:91-3501(-)
MFLNNISAATPITQRPDTGVLLNFPHEIRRNLISLVNSILVDKQNSIRILTSTFHIKWANEVIGQAFALPIEEYRSIEQSIEIYHRWLLGVDIPAPFDEELNFFYRDIFAHMSLIFQPRKVVTQEILTKHIQLCKNVINIYQEVALERSQNFSTETWEYLLNTLIGISDSLVSNESNLTNELFSYLIRLLYDVWLRSSTKNLEMWERLRKSSISWRLKTETITQWIATIFGLTNKVINILYGPTEGNNLLVIDLPKIKSIGVDPKPIEISHEQIIFSWNRFLQMIGNPNEITMQSLFWDSMMGIQKCIKALLDVGSKYDPKTTSEVIVDHPDGNSILRVFGNWLFEAISMTDLSFSDGISVAYSSLCQIFTSHQKNPLEDVYLSKFYEGIIRIFSNPNSFGKQICATIANSEKIFSCGLRGVHILIPFYLFVLKKIIPNRSVSFTTNIPLNMLRRSSITILSSLISSPHYFEKTQIISIDSKVLDTSFKDFQSISGIFQNILVSGFMNEQDPINAQMILWLMSSHLHEDISDISSLPSLYISTIQDFITNPNEVQNSWPISCFLVACDVLHSMVYLFNQMNKISPKIVMDLVAKLSAYITNLINQPGNTPQEVINTKISRLYEVISDYITKSQWIYESPMALSDLITSFEAALQMPQAKSKPGISQQVQDFAFIAFMNLYRQVGNFPLPLGPSTKCSLITEKQIMNKFKFSESELLQRTRHFVHENQRILTFIEGIPEKESEESPVFIIIRDLTGRNSWKGKFWILPLSFIKPDEKSIKKHIWEGEVISPVYPRAIKMTEYKQQEMDLRYNLVPLYNFLSSPMEVRYHYTFAFVENQNRVEEVYRFIEESSAVKLFQKRTSRPNHTDKKWQFNMARLLLSNFGYTHPDWLQSLDSIPSSLAILNELKNIDQLPNRYQTTIGVMYLYPGQNRLTDNSHAFMNSNGSSEFEKFILELGWAVSLDKHQGFKGLLTSELVSNGIYYSSFLDEVIFHLPSALTTEESRKAIIQNDSVIIVWCDDPRPFVPDLIRTPKNQVFIVIRPFFTSLYSIQIFNYSTHDIICGPLLNNSIVARPLLAHFVRLTALNYSKELAFQNDSLPNPSVIRKNHIQKFIEGSKLDYPSYDLYHSFFISKEGKK